MLTSRLTQDCLENLFSCLRSKNPVPNALEFVQNLRLLSVSQYLKASKNSSYEEDEGGFLANVLDIPKKDQDSNLLHDSTLLFNYLFPDTNEMGEAHLSLLPLDEVDKVCLYNLAGYVVSRFILRQRRDGEGYDDYHQCCYRE